MIPLNIIDKRIFIITQRAIQLLIYFEEYEYIRSDRIKRYLEGAKKGYNIQRSRGN